MLWVVNLALIQKTHSTLYWAHSEQAGPVVLKASQYTGALERELRAHVKLLSRPHKNIVPLLDYFVDASSREVLVFPAFPGDLRCATLSLVDIPQAMHQLLNGLHFLHSIGITHMDINPKNLVWDPDTHQLGIIDFGLATFEDTPLVPGWTDGK